MEAKLKNKNNMNYKPHLARIQNQYGALVGFDECTDFDKCVIILKQNGCTYKEIQKWLGNPAKDLIKEVILKYIPDSLNTDNNKNKLKSQQYPNEKRLLGLLGNQESRFYDLDEFGKTNFYIVEGRLYFIDENNICTKFIDWDERTQLSIIQNIARILNFKL
jgi:hypothetical protein